MNKDKYQERQIRERIHDQIVVHVTYQIGALANRIHERLDTQVGRGRRNWVWDQIWHLDSWGPVWTIRYHNQILDQAEEEIDATRS
jgi:hypothetical protein